MTKLNDYEITRMKIKRIEKEIRDTPYNKSTERHIGLLRARLSKLKTEIEERASKKSGSGGGYSVKKQGDATVVLVGPPSAGKSTLINRLTNAHSKIAPYSFTTVTVIPGILDYKDAKIQILDVPGLIEGAEIGKGRGREVLSVVRGSDLLVIMTDTKRIKAFNSLTDSLELAGIRINKKPPDVRIEKKMKGGIQIFTNVRQELDKDTITEVAKEFRIINAEITIKEKLTMDNLIDAFARNRVYIPALYTVNKVDETIQKYKDNHFDDSNHRSLHNTLLISAEKNIGLNKLKEAIFQKLEFIRVYLVKADSTPNSDNPLIIKRGMSLRQVSESIGEEFAEDKKNSVIWGTGAKFPGQTVSLNTIALDGMQVRFV